MDTTRRNIRRSQLKRRFNELYRDVNQNANNNVHEVDSTEGDTANLADDQDVDQDVIIEEQNFQAAHTDEFNENPMDNNNNNNNCNTNFGVEDIANFAEFDNISDLDSAVEEDNHDEGMYDDDVSNNESVVMEDNQLLSHLKYIIAIEKFSQPSSDGLVKLYPGSLVTKDEATALIDEYINITDGLTAKDTVRLLSLIHKILPPNSHLPIHFSKSGNLVSDMNKYTRSYQSYVLYQCCPCGGIVYVGENSSLDRCPVEHLVKVAARQRRKLVTCNTYRWTRCKHCGKEEGCDHSAYRIPLFQLQYRPITFIMLELLKQGESFLKLLNCINMDDMRQKQMYSDVMDSNMVVEQLNIMETKYLNKYNGRYVKPKMVNVVIDLSYDGAQIYKRRVGHFYPLLISILNFPPALRKKLGIGMFMLSIFALKQGKLFILYKIGCSLISVFVI